MCVSMHDVYVCMYVYVCVYVYVCICIYMWQGNVKVAIPLLERAVAIGDTLQCGEGSHMLVWLNNLASAYSAVGRTDEASVLFK